MSSRHRQNALWFSSLFVVLMVANLSALAQGSAEVSRQAARPAEISLGAAHAVRDEGKPALPQTFSAVPRVLTLNGVVRGEARGEAQPQSRLVGVLFALYEEQEGGAPLWQEVQNVHVDGQGRYSVLLGSTQAEGLPSDIFTTGQARWLGVQVEGEKEQPRILLVSVPYALKAADAETLGGRPASEFVLAKPDSPSSASEKGRGENKTPQEASLGGGGTPQVTAGTAGRIAKFTNATDLGDSVMFESAGNIGVGTATPASLLHLSATSPELRLTSTSSSSIPQLSFYDGATLGGVFQFRNSGATDPNIFRLGGIVSGSQFAVVTSGTEKLRVNAAGNVGIGTTTPGAILHLSSASPELRLTSTSSASIPQLSFYDGATLGGFFQYRNSGAADPNIFSLGSKPAGSQFAIFTGGAEKVRVTAAGNVGIGTTTPGQKLTVVGMVQSTSGGFKFPDGTIQTTAANTTAGDITAVTAGTGLTGGGTSGAVSLSLLTSCSASQILKWNGSSWGCATDATSSGAGGGPASFSGNTTSINSSIVSATQSGSIAGVLTGLDFPPAALRGDSTAASNGSLGVLGTSASFDGVAVLGLNYGSGWGVGGVNNGNGRAGTYGAATATTGFAVGVYGIAQSPDAWASAFDNRAGGDLIVGRAGPANSEVIKFRVDSSGNVRLGATANLFASSGEENLRILRGTVNANGTCAAGSGFTCAKGLTGTYQIFFNANFSSAPSIVANPVDTLNAFKAVIHGPAVDNFVLTLENGTTLADGAFSFIAIGPR